MVRAKVSLDNFAIKRVGQKGPIPMYEFTHQLLQQMTPAQRRHEIASLLANGLARLRIAGIDKSAGMAMENEFELDCSGHQSVHTDPVNERNTESR
jgi:hypothetical protein